ncbi:MAG: T9SS type A sorting domain-containing protein [Bacteroidota bacterium]
MISGVTPSHVSLQVYDIMGRFVETLIDKQENPGFHTIMWNASGLASGVYYYRLSMGVSVQTRAMVLVK